VEEPPIQIHEDLASPLAPKRKRGRSAKESDNIAIDTEMRERLAEVSANRSQRALDSTQNQAIVEDLAARNGKEAPAKRKPSKRGKKRAKRN
jgi:hypothetical protein